MNTVFYLILWILLGLLVLSFILAGLAVFIGYVTQVAFIEDLDDWKDND